MPTLRFRLPFPPAPGLLAAALLATALPASGSDAGRTDELARLAERFQAEVYPVLARSANGCLPCHSAQASQAFRVLDTPVGTFSLLLEGELLDPSDAMAVPSRITTASADLRMPMAGSLDPSEIDRIVRFSKDLSRVLKGGDGEAAHRRDERFPDSLLLPYDGPAKADRARRRMSYYQLKRSVQTLFGTHWLAESGADPFRAKAPALGGADFRGSFDQTRTVTASYLSAWQEIAREVARRYVSAPKETLFEDFDPDLLVEESPAAAARAVRALYQSILFADPSDAETDRALRLVRELQARPQASRKVRFTLAVEDAAGRQDTSRVDVTLRSTRASVSRHWIDQGSATAEEPWVRVGDRPFTFRAGRSDHLVRLVARPGNHITVFDAVKLVRVRDGVEDAEALVLDNLDPECTLSEPWTPVAKQGELSRAGGPKKKYDEDLGVFGSNHLEWRNVDNRLASAEVVPRVPEDGNYNVYLNCPRVPRTAPAALVEVHSATSGQAPPPAAAPKKSPGFATVHIDQTESTLDEEGGTQWEELHRVVRLSDPQDYVEISNRGVDSTSKVIVADAVKFVPLDGGTPIVVDNASEEGFEASEGWAPDQLVRNLPGRGKMHGDDILHYPPAKSGEPIKDQEIDPELLVWARYRPVAGGEYRPGWYSVQLWTPGGHTHADWVAVDVHGSEFGPVTSIEAPPAHHTGETAALNAAQTYHPGGSPLKFHWTHDAADLGIRLEGAATPWPRFAVPSLQSARPGWAGLIEALLQRPEFLMPDDSPDAPPSVQLVRTALDLVGRVPTSGELERFRLEGQFAPLIDEYLASEDFRAFFFHRARGVFRSRGTPESDEPARLWTYIAINDLPYRELFTAEYTIDEHWQRVARRPVHGPTGFLTMPGYLEGRPGLPKFTYPAQVLSFALGIQFEVSEAVEDARDTVVSTTDPSSICYSCHRLLTPLAYQRERWDEHGHYRSVDEAHEAINDSDRGVVPDYPFAGTGLSAFASQVVRKERFVRSFVNRHHDMLFHRQLRVLEDQRDEYRELHEFALANELRVRPLLRRMLLMRLAEADQAAASRQGGSRAERLTGPPPAAGL